MVQNLDQSYLCGRSIDEEVDGSLLYGDPANVDTNYDKPFGCWIGG
jgi:hypothetical protein